MPESEDPNIATCPSCSTLIDVSEQEPFTLINCSVCGAQMRVRQEFAHFEIQGILGEGGQGVVYRALDRKLSRPVAIKVMKRQYSADPDFVQRFASEARITASLNHPNIVKVYSFGEYRGLLYLAMEMVDHGSLESLMAQAKKVPEFRALDVAIQIAGGLRAGLALGLIHRDIKPGNILFADERTAKIVDFGLAILVEKQHDERGDVWATPYYVAPEKLDGRAEDFRSDMYSLAATLFHALAGRPPFISETNSMDELKKIKARPVHIHNFANHVSAAAAFTIDKALSADPQQRFQSYDDFIHNLEYARDQLRKAPARGRHPRSLTARTSSSGGGFITFAMIALVVGGGLFWWIRHEQGDGRDAENGKGGTGSGQTDPSAELKFDEARKQLADGKFEEAAKAFRALYEGTRLPEPKASWAGVHLGVSEYFAGHSGKAAAAFKSLHDRIAPSAIGLDPKLSAFLSQLADIGSDKPDSGSGTPDSATPDMEKFDKSSYEAMAFLVAGAKKWDAGAFDEAVALFRQFQQTTPAGESEWVTLFHPLVARQLDEYAAFREIADAIAKGDAAPEAADAALKRIPLARAKIHSAILLKKLAALEAESSQKIAAKLAAAKDETDKKKADMQAADEMKLTAAKLTVKGLTESYRFTEAAATVKAVEVKLDESASERDLLAKRMDWLVQFKRQLIEDLNTGGCVVPLQRKSGQQIVGGVARADDEQLQVRVQFGSLPVKWTDITPQSILQMARFYMKPTLAPGILADRKWRAGVFCVFNQLFDEGQALMDEAAPQNAEYQTHRALFFGQPTPAPEAPKPAPPADGAAAAN